MSLRSLCYPGFAQVRLRKRGKEGVGRNFIANLAVAWLYFLDFWGGFAIISLIGVRAPLQFQSKGGNELDERSFGASHSV